MPMITDNQRLRLSTAIESAVPLLESGEYRSVTIPDDIEALTKEDAETAIGNIENLVPIGYDYTDKVGELWTVSDYSQAARDGHDGPESLGL